MCPICLDDLNNGEELDNCKYSCGKAIHIECYKLWSNKKEKKCIFCKTDWEKKSKSDYINLL